MRSSMQLSLTWHGLTNTWALLSSGIQVAGMPQCGPRCVLHCFELAPGVSWDRVSSLLLRQCLSLILIGMLHWKFLPPNLKQRLLVYLGNRMGTVGTISQKYPTLFFWTQQMCIDYLPCDILFVIGCRCVIGQWTKPAKHPTVFKKVPEKEALWQSHFSLYKSYCSLPMLNHINQGDHLTQATTQL